MPYYLYIGLPTSLPSDICVLGKLQLTPGVLAEGSSVENLASSSVTYIVTCTFLDPVSVPPTVTGHTTIN